jgi:hypothetical protein
MFVGAGRLKVMVGALATMLVVTSSVAAWHQAQATAARGGTWFEVAGVDDWRGISALYRWIDDNASAKAVLIATHDPTFYLFTGRTALRPDSMDPLMLYYNISGRPEDTAAVDEAFRRRVISIGADYIVVTPRDDFARLARVSGRFPGSLTLAEGDLASKHAIYRVDRAKLTSDTEAKK